jgi:hypothetical protein
MENLVDLEEVERVLHGRASLRHSSFVLAGLWVIIVGIGGAWGLTLNDEATKSVYWEVCVLALVPLVIVSIALLVARWLFLRRLR